MGADSARYVNQQDIATFHIPDRSSRGTVGDDLANFGINSSPPAVQPTAFGPIRRATNLTKGEWLLFILCAVALLGCTGITIQRIITLGTQQNCEANKVDVTLAIVLLLNTLFCIFYTFSGIFGERSFELVALAGAFVIVTAYCIENYIMVPSVLKLVRLCIVVVASIGLVPLCVYFALRYQRGNLIYRLLASARADLQRMLRQRFLCETLLNFDLQMALSMVILILRSYAKYEGPEETENCMKAESFFAREKMRLHRNEVLTLSIGLPVCLIWTLIGYVSLRLEQKTLAILFFGLCLFEPAYVVYKIVDVVKERDTIDWTILVVAVLSFGILSLINRVLLLWQFAVCYSNFGKGLRERLLEQQRKGFDSEPIRTRARSTDSTGFQGSINSSTSERAQRRGEKENGETLL